MSKFKLKETTVPVRGVDVQVRELSHKERTEYIKNSDDKFALPAKLTSLGTIDPKMTEDQWSEEPAEVLDVISSKIAELSGLGGKTKRVEDAKALAAGIAKAIKDLTTLPATSKVRDDVVAALSALIEKDDVQKESNAGAAV